MNNTDPNRREFLSHGGKMLAACAMIGAGSAPPLQRAIPPAAPNRRAG